jgi:hypothetical protein
MNGNVIVERCERRVEADAAILPIMFTEYIRNGSAVYLEDPRRTTIDVRGAKHVLLQSTGFASMRITAVLAVKADGSKVTPLVILKGKETWYMGCLPVKSLGKLVGNWSE